MTATPRIAVLGTIAAIAFLAVARSALVPDSLAFATPVAASAILLVALAAWGMRLRLPLSVFPVVLLGLILVVATGLRANLLDTVKAAGIGVLWILALAVGGALDARARAWVVRSILAIAVLSVAVILLETVAQSELVRSTVAATAGQVYVWRPNSILGPWTNRGQGTFGYPIAMCHFLAVSFALALYSGAVTRRIGIIVAGLSFVGVLFTGTRAGLLAVAVALAVGWMTAGARRPLKTFGGLLVAAVAAFLLVQYASAAGTVGDESILHRSNILASFPTLFRRSVAEIAIGSGLNSTSSLFGDGLLEMGSTGALDNAYVSTFVAVGLVGLLIVCGYLFVAMTRGRVDFRPALATFAVFFLTYDALWWHAISALFWLLIGISLSAGTAKSDAALPTSRDSLRGEVVQSVGGSRV